MRYIHLVILLIVILLLVMINAVPASAQIAGTVETVLGAAAAPYIVAVVAAVASVALGWLAATSERFAAPARAKSPEERTLMDKAAIEADRCIDLANIDIIERFATRWVHANLPRVLQGPVFDPLRQAEGMVDDALEAFKRRNPEIAAATGIGPLTLQEILAAVIGRDQLAAALRERGLSGAGTQ